MDTYQIVLIIIIVLFGIFVVYLIANIISKINNKKKEKKIDSVYNPENLVEQDAFNDLKESETIKSEETNLEKENKFFN